MACCSVTSKAMLDIEDCIAELKKSFLTEKILNDDSPALHRLEEKLELILLVGFKEKPGVFGGKRSYWDYISACLSSSKRPHPGLKFVKSNSELKTSLGRGRALIRFCLMHKCLADTLQSCFMDNKTTRDFYSERCLPLQPKLWSSFITALYDLNEINFDLNPQHAELDVSWPSFARKLFVPSKKQILSERNLSSDLTDFSMVNGEGLNNSSEDKYNERNEGTQNLVDANSELEADVLFLQKKCETLEKDICSGPIENNDQVFGLVPESIDKLASQNILDCEKRNNNYCYQSNSLNDTKDGCKRIGMELNFNVKQDTQRVCNFRTELSGRKSCELLQNISSDDNQFRKEYKSYSDLPTLSNSHILQNPLISILNSEQIKSTLVSVKSENDMNKVESPKFINFNCNDRFLLSNTAFFNQAQTFNLEISDSTSNLLLEMKGLIDNLSNSMYSYSADSEVLSDFTRLKTIRDSLETNYFTGFKKLNEYETQKQHMEDYAYCLKSLALKQDSLIDSLSDRVNSSLKENESLYERMSFLKDRLHSFGLLKIQTEIGSNVQSSPLTSNKESAQLGSNSGEDINWDVGLCDYVSKDSLEALHIFKKSSSKLGALNTQAAALQLWLDSSHRLNNNLISRVQDQEMHMKGITKELEEAHRLLSVMRKQHQKLQSAENIVKYDLQEKRKLLTRLKQELEATREDCNLVRIKNSKSEVEWQNLRKEFVKRNKQTSEESGFVDDKGLEDHSAIINTTCEHNFTNDSSKIDSCLDHNDEVKYDLKKNRLKMLEDQCKLLCSNLVNGSKKRQEIDCRLESWCKAIEKSREASGPETLSKAINMNHVCKSEIVSENVDSSSNMDDSLPSSEIESVNYDNSSIPHNSTAISTDVSFSLESLKNDYCVSSKITNLECSQIETLPEDINLKVEVNPISNSICSAVNHKNFEILEDISCCSSIESLDGIEDCSMKSLDVSEVNSLNSQENELQGTISTLTRKSTSLETDAISKLQKEKKILETKFQELEKKYMMISQQLALKSQQLKLTEAAKEQEITALQFQLNSEVLKYERALKEFAENNDGLKDMKQKVNDQEELILTLEEALSEIQVERESEKDHQWEQLQDIQLALAAREEECILLSADLEKLEDFKKYCLSDREMMKSEITHLQSDSKELQKKIIKLLKEKDILWKRNDHLTYLQKIQIDDRWVSDHEVSQCLGCRSHFSFLLRKHHCRQCGRIFCNSCSNNWLLTASSRKQIRICDECYIQHLEIKNVVRRDSNVQCCDSDDEAIDDDAVSITLNKSFSSENQPRITGSIVSLPVTHETNRKPKSLYASAPELHMATENHEVLNTNCVMDPALMSQIEAVESGDLFIQAGEEAELPVLSGGNSTSLHWSFKPNNETIPISLFYEDTTYLKTQPTVLHQSACETEGVMHLSLPGLYKFHFDNRSRNTSKSVHYNFTTAISKEEDIQS